MEGEQIWGMYSSDGPTAELWSGGDCVIPSEARALSGRASPQLCLQVGLTTRSTSSFRPRQVTIVVVVQTFYQNLLVSFDPAHTLLESRSKFPT